MIVRMDDFYRISYKGKEFDFKVLELKESTHMCIVGSDEKVQELLVELLKPKDESDEEYYPDLFDALKEGLRKGHIAKTFGKNVLEITFYFNKGVLIRLFANNIRAEHGIRVAETALFMDGKQIYEELDRLFLKLSENQEDFWICSDFYDNVWQDLVEMHLSNGVYFYILWILKQETKRWYNILYDNHLLTKYEEVNK